MKPIVFYDFKPDKDDPNNKIVIKKTDLEELFEQKHMKLVIRMDRKN